MSAHLKHNDLLDAGQKKLLRDEEKTLRKLVDDLEKAVAPYAAFLTGAHVDLRAQMRVADYLCDHAQRSADGQLRPHKKAIDQKLPDGGFARIFSKTPLSRVLRAGRVQTANFALRAAETIRLLPPSIGGTKALADRLESVGTKLETLAGDDFEKLEAKRRPLKLTVERRILEVREGLEKMDARLRELFDVDFIESLYPELARSGEAVADEDSEDDDMTGRPEPAPAPAS